jgi:hypothetical protein
MTAVQWAEQQTLSTSQQQRHSAWQRWRQHVETVFRSVNLGKGCERRASQHSMLMDCYYSAVCEGLTPCHPIWRMPSTVFACYF